MANIKRRPNGTWRARYRDDAGREHARHFSRKVDAQAWLAEITASVVTGQYVDPGAGKITFNAFYTDWARRQVWVPGTARAVAIAATSVPFGELPLATIRRSHIESWVKDLVVRGLEPSTVRTRFNYVRSVFRAAVRDRRLVVDPCDGVVLPRVRRAEAAMRLPTLAEVKALLDAAEVGFRPMLALALFAGMRGGEICAVQLGDVDWLGRALRVQRQVQREGKGTEIRPPKYGSERVVFLPDALLAELSEHVAAKHITDRDQWLFVGRDDGPARRQTLDYRWRSTMKAAKVADLRFHDCRHFYASGLIAEGCDVVTVQRALGHASAAITLKVYSHLWPSAEDRTRRAAGALFAAVASSPADSVRTVGEA